MELKLALLGHISLDGFKPVLSEVEGFKANSSRHKAQSHEVATIRLRFLAAKAKEGE